MIEQDTCEHLCEKFKETNIETFICDNHDDDITLATSRCDSCAENYCSDCDRHIHLSRDKVRRFRRSYDDHKM